MNREHRPVVLVVAVLALLALLLAVRAHSSNRAVPPRVHAAPVHVAARTGAVPPVVRVICAVFRGYCGQALRVSWCESRWRVDARNGQHLGLFQMGAWERARYGHGPSVWMQARAAYRYFTATGRTWAPWTCRP